MNINSIVACSRDNTNGSENQIPWYLPADLKYFKKITSGHIVIMGRKTYESIGRALPRRINIVVSKNKDFKAEEGVLVFSSFLDAIDYAQRELNREIFIIGGGEIYRQALAVSQKIYYTEVDTEILDATVFFPELAENEWKLISEEKHEKDEQNPYNYNFKIYERREPITVIAQL